METFWTLFRESVILQAILALMFGGTVCYMFATHQEVPGELLTLLGTIVGYYFGSKTQAAALKGVRNGQASSDPCIDQ